MTPPQWLDHEHEKDLWRKPWTVPLASSQARDFKRKLRAHGFLSPHFRVAEAGSRGGDGCGCPAEQPTGDDLTRAQYHAFALERVRHALGDRSLSPLSWLRSPCHNRCVGGASASQHLNGWASDWSDAERARHGGDRFDAAMERQFGNGGRGYLGHTGGPIRHVDNGPARTWVYA
jgi:hypothetical protein